MVAIGTMFGIAQMVVHFCFKQLLDGVTEQILWHDVHVLDGAAILR